MYGAHPLSVTMFAKDLRPPQLSPSSLFSLVTELARRINQDALRSNFDTSRGIRGSQQTRIFLHLSRTLFV